MRRFFAFNHPSHARLRAWLEKYPRVARALEKTGCLHVHRRAVARGVAIGLFVGLTPTVGLQTVIAIAACLLIRGNFPSAFLLSCVSNPITTPPLYLAFHAVGERVFAPIITGGMPVADLGQQAAIDAAYLGLGSLLIAIPAAVAGYAALTLIWRAWVARRRRTLRLSR